MSKPAARLTDMHTCPMVTGVVPHVGGPISAPGCPTVLIGALPAARVGDMAVCVGPPDAIAVGSPTVLIGGMMAARMGDQTIHGGVIVVGCPTVLIGQSGSGTSAAAGAALAKAAQPAEPLVQKAGSEAADSATRGPAAPSSQEIELVKAPGSSPAQRAARETVARHFYESRPGLGPDRYEMESDGIDLDHPVELVDVPPPEEMTQYVRKGKGPGKWFDPLGNQPGDSLGLNDDPKFREKKRFKTPRGQALKSTAAPVREGWTDPENPVDCKGGGTQMLMDGEMQSRFKEV